MKFSTILFLLVWAAVLAGVYLGLRYAQQNAVATYGTDQAQDEWESWRDDVRENAPTKGVTKRRVPKSPSPPALVLMQDYFVACLVFSMVMTSALYWTAVLVFRGSIQKTRIRED